MRVVAIFLMLTLNGCYYYEVRAVDTVVRVVSGRSLMKPRIIEPEPVEPQEIIRMKLRIAEKKLKLLKEQRMQQLLAEYHSLN